MVETMNLKQDGNYFVCRYTTKYQALDTSYTLIPQNKSLSSKDRVSLLPQQTKKNRKTQWMTSKLLLHMVDITITD